MGQVTEIGARISAQTAQENIDRFLKYYDIDLGDMPENVRRAVEASLAKIRRAIMNGQVEISFENDTITVKQHLAKPLEGFPGPVVYREVTGRAKIGIKDDSGDYGKMYNFLGALSAESPNVIMSLKGKDISLAEALGAVFLQV